MPVYIPRTEELRRGPKGDKGERGPMGAGTTGPRGPAGVDGQPGDRGSIWQPSGSGAPTSFPGQQDGDLYLDVDTDQVYQLESGTWTLVGDFTGAAGPPGPPGPPGPSTGPAGGVLSGTYPNPGFAADMATQAELDAEALSARNADNLTSGTVADGRIASTIARDSEVTSAIATQHTADQTEFANAASTTSALAGKQPLDSDLTTIAGLTATTDNIIQSVGSAWASRTPAQVKTALALNNVDNVQQQPKVVAATTATASGTAAKTATISGYTPTTGDVLALTFTNGTNIAAPTLSINGGSALAIAIAGNTGSTASNMVITANGVLLLYYSGSRWEAFGPQFSHATTSQATAEAGTSTNVEWWTALRVRQSTVAYDSVAATLTNKRVTRRVSTTADTATLTIDSDSYDGAKVTALAQAMTIAAPTGTPTAMQGLIIRIKDNGTARALTWNAAFRAIGVTLPTTTVISKTHYIGCIWNSDDSKWDAIAVVAQA